MKVRRVMAARLEASRSIPELDEGGESPLEVLRRSDVQIVVVTWE